MTKGIIIFIMTTKERTEVSLSFHNKLRWSIRNDAAIWHIWLGGYYLISFTEGVFKSWNRRVTCDKDLR